MNRYVVLGVNENPKYKYYVPLVVWAWNRLGWDTILFTTHKWEFYFVASNPGNVEIIEIEPINGYKSETIAQISRLYGGLASVHPRAILMTSDCDMLPLSNYWNPSDLNVTCYGRDLTDYHYPICYCAMTASKWLDVMMYTDESVEFCMKHDLDERPKTTNAWTWDQDILTERLNRYGKKLLTLVHRGTDVHTGYPVGRVDRSFWTLGHKQLIDAHLPHDILTNEKSFHKVMELLHHVWPNESFKWFLDYHKEFKKLL